MTFEGEEYDYVETAVALGEPSRSGRGAHMETDHACNPAFVYPAFGVESWHPLVTDDFEGVAKVDHCGTCQKRALLRMPKHLLMALRLRGAA